MEARRNSYPLEAAFVETRSVDGVCVAVIDARVLSDHQVDAARHRLCQLAREHAGRLAISMASSEGSSMGLYAALLQVQQFCASCNGKMVLFCLPDRAAEALGAFGLLDRLNLVDDLEQALDLVHGRSTPNRRGSWLSQVLGIGRAAA